MKYFLKYPEHSFDHFKIQTKWLLCTEIPREDADIMANSVDPAQTAPLGAPSRSTPLGAV